MEACQDQLLALKNILHDFSASTGIKVNFSKSMMIPINVEDSKAALLAQLIGCELGTLPFTYLGLPLGLTKPKVVDFLPPVTKCERRLAYTSAFLSQAGRLEVTNSIFTSFPMFCMSTFKLHKTVIKQVFLTANVVENCGLACDSQQNNKELDFQVTGIISSHPSHK